MADTQKPAEVPQETPATETVAETTPAETAAPAAEAAVAVPEVEVAPAAEAATEVAAAEAAPVEEAKKEEEVKPVEEGSLEHKGQGANFPKYVIARWRFDPTYRPLTPNPHFQELPLLQAALLVRL